MARAAAAAAVALVVSFGAFPAQSQEPAAEFPAATLVAARAPIDALYAALLDAMKRAEKLGFSGRAAALRPAVLDSYDLDFMAAKVLGRYWKGLGEADQARWRDAFTSLTVSTYADRFTGFKGEVFEILAVEPSSRGTIIVRTQIVPEGEEAVAVDYRMREAEDGWRIIDVYLNGTVSELALRRSEYTTVLKRDGFESLVDSLEGKFPAAAE